MPFMAVFSLQKLIGRWGISFSSNSASFAGYVDVLFDLNRYYTTCNYF